MKILVADDEIMTLRLLEQSLDKAGYDVVSARDGRLALEQLCLPYGPRLALLDWNMPGLDGPAVCEQVRKRSESPYIYIVLVTSRESKQDVVLGLESGADDYLIKPWNPEELKARLRTGQRILRLEDRLVEARETMRFKATHDHLTSLFNRGSIVDLLDRELTRTRRENSCSVIMMADLDHFKMVNDSFGHLVGDEVLREVARRLLGSVRSYDLVGRYGGEEFLAVLNNCDTSQALLRAEQIRNAVANFPIRTMRGPLAVTMSLGVLSSRDWPLSNSEEILREVDAALYLAKAAGRNCCQLAKPNSAIETPQELLK
jgi:two-component system cell cycle response regulator